MAAADHSTLAAATGGRTRSGLRTAVVWDYLRTALDGIGPAPLRVVDAGGGTGGFAVPLAQLGHDVTVVDPSPDSLAALERRAAETGVAARVHALQGDAAGLAELVPEAAFDVVLGHSVLEFVDDPDEALRAMAATVRAGGIASVLAANRSAAVLARVGAGRLAEARRLFSDETGSAGEGDPVLRRFSLAELQAALVAAGLRPRTVHGVRIFADIVPASVIDTDVDAVDDLLALERAAAQHSDYLSLATQFHVLADRG